MLRGGTEARVVNTLLGPTWFVASGQNIGGEKKKKVGICLSLPPSPTPPTDLEHGD